MKMIGTVRLAVLASAALLLAACAGGPQFPKTGQVSAYDGFWAGNLEDSCTTSSKTTIKGEVRYGHFIGEIHNTNLKKLGEVWGQIDPSGSFDGLLGSYGISGGWAKVQFQPNGTATGAWATHNCDGKVLINRS